MQSAVARVLVGLVVVIALVVGGALALRSTKPVPVRVVEDDEQPPPITTLPTSVEQAQAFSRRTEKWSVGTLVARRLFGLREMWLDGFNAACASKDDALMREYIAMLTVPVDLKANCPIAFTPKADPFDALYARAPAGTWFDETDTHLRALLNGKRYWVKLGEPEALLARLSK